MSFPPYRSNNNTDKSSLPVCTSQKSSKRKRKQVLIANKENDTFENDTSENNNDLPPANHSPLDDVTNSTLKLRHTKRKRRP
jgi:hypothetical protein